MPSIETRRDFLRKAAAALSAAAVSGLVLPEIVKAQDEWQPRYDFWRTQIPEPITGRPDERVGLYLSTSEGNTAAITCGPFSWTDKFGVKVDFPGGEDRATFAIVKGPIGPEHGGELVVPRVVPLHNWVGVTENPAGGLKDIHWLTIAREREASLRNISGFKGSQIDMVVIDGRIGAIEFMGTLLPKR